MRSVHCCTVPNSFRLIGSFHESLMNICLRRWDRDEYSRQLTSRSCMLIVPPPLPPPPTAGYLRRCPHHRRRPATNRKRNIIPWSGAIPPAAAERWKPATKGEIGPFCKFILTSEASPIVVDFTISVYGSLCYSLCFALLLSSFLSISISWHSFLPWGCHYIEREQQRNQEEAKKEILYFMNSRTQKC